MKLKSPGSFEANVPNVRPFVGIKTSHTLLKERTFFWSGYSKLSGKGVGAACGKVLLPVLTTNQ
jgi:hypothetical protein